jgi:hypothetical protein
MNLKESSYTELLLIYSHIKRLLRLQLTAEANKILMTHYIQMNGLLFMFYSDIEHGSQFWVWSLTLTKYSFPRISSGITDMIKTIYNMQKYCRLNKLYSHSTQKIITFIELIRVRALLHSHKYRMYSNVVTLIY